jgi:hypothetical protein
MKRVAIGLFMLATLGFFAYALVDAWTSTSGEMPSVARLAIAGILVCAGLLVSAFAWARLLDGRWMHHGPGLLVAQLAKYVPGGIWQATGQVGLARSAGIPVSQGATAFGVFALCQAMAGATTAVVLAFTLPDVSPAMRVLVGVGGAASVVLLDRRWIVWALGRLPKARDGSAALVPSQRVIVLAWICCVVATLTAAGAYVVLLAGFSPVDNPLFVIAAYAAAWTVGFVAVPIPAGFGVREAVLVGILHGTFPTSVIVAASVYHRLVMVASEGLMAALTGHRVRSRRGAAPPPGHD